MNPTIILGALLFLAACSKSKPEQTQTSSEVPEANNAMTNYADSLHSDMSRAQNAVDKMNKSVDKTNKEYREENQ